MSAFKIILAARYCSLESRSILAQDVEPHVLLPWSSIGNCKLDIFFARFVVHRLICFCEAIFWMIKSNTNYQSVVSTRDFRQLLSPKVFCFETCLIFVSPTFNSRLSVSFNRFLALINMYVVLSNAMGNLFL